MQNDRADRRTKETEKCIRKRKKTIRTGKIFSEDKKEKPWRKKNSRNPKKRAGTAGIQAKRTCTPATRSAPHSVKRLDKRSPLIAGLQKHSNLTKLKHTKRRACHCSGTTVPLERRDCATAGKQPSHCKGTPFKSEMTEVLEETEDIQEQDI